MQDGRTHPTWLRAASLSPVPPAGKLAATCDVLVIGAGIAGLTSAFLLAKAGKSVIVLDDSGPSSGESLRTSAHLASEIDDRYFEVEKAVGEEGIKLAHRSHAGAIDFIERVSKTENINCDFARLDAYLFLSDEDEESTLDHELDAAGRAGESVEKTTAPLNLGPALKFARQARFHPLKYYRGLQAACERMGVRFHTAQATDTTGGSPVVTQTHDGGEIKSAAAVVATNVPSPINDWLGVYLKQAPYRTYMLAFEVDPFAIPDALYWDTGDPYQYVRLDTAVSPALLLVGGADHKVGQPPKGGPEESFRTLEAWARKHFPAAGELSGRWSGQVNEPADFLAYAGLAPTKGGNVYCITGDSGMGLTHGTLGAQICADAILGLPNEFAELYSPTRKPKGQLLEFAKEQLNVAAQYLHLLTGGDVSSVSEIAPGFGAVIREGLKKIAVYKADDGTVSRCSAVCTHLGCIVKWNDAEGSWDCPCHGSRFSPTGAVLNGPAVEPLANAD